MRVAGLRQWSIALALVMASSSAALAQSPESNQKRVEELYASAEYEQALTLLDGAKDQTSDLYRALCLLALGRQEETRRAVESLVAGSPEFVTSAEEVPPKFVTLVTETRKAMLPTVLRKIFAEARGHYQAKEFERAVPLFEKVLRVAGAADVRDLEDVSDLRVLAEGFIDLAKAPQMPVPQASLAAVPAAPAGAQPASVPAARVTTPARALKQEIPPWPTELGSSGIASVGAVRVQINETGRVTGAAMLKSIHPRYDTRILAATRFWQYAPATINGVATDSESVVEIKVAR